MQLIQNKQPIYKIQKIENKIQTDKILTKEEEKKLTLILIKNKLDNTIDFHIGTKKNC